jgi:CHAT domain-containing protein
VTARESDVLAGLALTPPDSAATRSDDDGYLQLYEIYELPLACELAVLSACGTQRGRRVPGEGVFALARGFQAAGARRVVASLWEVGDESTASLVGGFFARLAKADSDPGYSRALRDARRRVRSDRRWSDPFYWAPFTLSGAR